MACVSYRALSQTARLRNTSVSDVRVCTSWRFNGVLSATDEHLYRMCRSTCNGLLIDGAQVQCGLYLGTLLPTGARSTPCWLAIRNPKTSELLRASTLLPEWNCTGYNSVDDVRSCQRSCFKYITLQRSADWPRAQAIEEVQNRWISMQRLTQTRCLRKLVLGKTQQRAPIVHVSLHTSAILAII